MGAGPGLARDGLLTAATAHARWVREKDTAPNRVQFALSEAHHSNIKKNLCQGQKVKSGCGLLVDMLVLTKGTRYLLEKNP